MKRRNPLVATALVLAVVAALGLASTAGAARPRKPSKAGSPNPCQSREASHLLCPNLRIGTPSDLFVSTEYGKTLLHATSDVRSRGRGPIELHGHRDGPRHMRTVQRIYRVGGGHISLRSEATLNFTNVGYYFGGSYWKVHQLAHFDLRPVLPGGGLGDPVRSSPKLNYCLRDLERTRPGRRSPPRRHYPACNQNPQRDRVTLGTSIGWSDIYPADYEDQYIDVTGLRGCFVFEMTVDPQELLVESNDRDNSSRRRVRLPYTGAGC